MTNAVRAEKLTKSFDGKKVVNSLTFSVAPGEIFGLVGPDGAGKTTSMRMLTSIMDPTEGNAWVLDLDTVKRAEAIKEKIGYMSQRFGLYADLTVLENLRFYADIYGVTKAQREVEFPKLLGFSQLTPFQDRLAGALSGGMKQKLGLACALVHTPQILFLDEPTNGVDPVSRRDFWRILYQLHAEKVTIFISTSYLDEAERCGRLAFLHEGSLLALGTPEEIKMLQKGIVIETRTESPRKAMMAIRQDYPADAVRLFGNAVHTIVEKSSEISKIQSLLEADGLTDIMSTPVEPSLEDVFISLSADGEASHDS